MPGNESWIAQGRQDHGRFGSGTSGQTTEAADEASAPPTWAGSWARTFEGSGSWAGEYGWRADGRNQSRLGSSSEIRNVNFLEYLNPITPAEAQTITPDRVQHILSRHGPGGSDLGAGRFNREYANPEALQELAVRIWEQATPEDIGAARHGFVAVAGAMFKKDLSTGIAIPDIVGEQSGTRLPTNVVVMILDQKGNVVTMYPSGPITPYQPH